MTDQNDMSENDDLFDGLEVPSMPTPSGSASPAIKADADTDDEEGEEEGEDSQETGVHENAVDSLLSETGTPGAGIPPLTPEEEFTVQVKVQFEAACKHGEELLKANDLEGVTDRAERVRIMRDRCKAIESVSNEIDSMLDKGAIKSDEELLRKGRDLRSELRLYLESTLLKLCLEPSGATPSSLPKKIEGIADHELERMALGLSELSLKAATEQGKKSAEKLLEMIESDKARRAATPRVSVPPPSGEHVTGHEPTQAVSLTPVPPAPEAEKPSMMIPPAAPAPQPIEASWQSGPEAPKVVDPNQVVTQDAPAEPKPASSPSNQENPMHNSMPGQVRTQMRVGRASDNDWVIDNPTVSSHHALLTLNEGSIKVEDLGSSNGTFYANELGGWNRVPKEHPATVLVGRAIKFGSVVISTTRDAQCRTHLHFVVDSGGKLSASQAFFLSGEELSKLNALEQARLDEESAKQPEPPKEPEQAELRKSPTEFQREVKSGSSPWPAILAVGALGILLMSLVGAGVFWVAGHLPGREVATTETETSTESETESTSETVTEAVTESETAETETSTPTVEPATDTAPGSYTCRPGREIDACDNLQDFLLARADGEAYWDCSDITPEQYRNLYRIEDPRAATRRVIANTCACQYCEPSARD